MRLIDADNLIDYFYFDIDDKPIIDGISDRKIIDSLTLKEINLESSSIRENFQDNME